MKRSIRLPFSLLLLISACIVLTLTTASRRRVESVSPAGKPSLADPATNETLLLKMAAADPADAAMTANVADLLNVNFPAAVYDFGRHRSISVWRRENQHYHHHHYLDDHRVRSAGKYPIRFRSAKDLRSFPEFRRSLRDWHRRRRFQPSVMSELLDLVKRHIDRSAEHRYGSCAVVGNSGVLLEKSHGGLIDGHDLVVRLNNARIDGYERHVGSKTNLSFVNSNILHLCARRENCFCHPYGESTPIIMYICQPLHFLDYALCNSSHKAPLLVTDPRLDILCARIVRYYSLKRFSVETGRPLEEWAKSHDERAFHYSSGMQAIMLALGICDRVSVFGFGKPSGTKHHYHTNQKAELKLHDYEAEYEFYRDLTNRPQLNQQKKRRKKINKGKRGRRSTRRRKRSNEPGLVTAAVDRGDCGVIAAVGEGPCSSRRRMTTTSAHGEGSRSAMRALDLFPTAMRALDLTCWLLIH